MAITRLYCGNDTDIMVEPFLDASSGEPLNDAELFATIGEADRSGAITAATNAGPIEITSAIHGLTTGDYVAILNVGGNTAARGTWQVTVTGPDTFTLNDSTGNGAYTGGGRWYLALDDAEAREIPLVLNGANRFLGVLPGTVGLQESGRYAVVTYATGDYRDRYNQVDIATAVLRTGAN